MYRYSLVILSNNVEFLSPLELLLIVLSVWGLLLISSPIPEDNYFIVKLKDFSVYIYLVQAWSSQASLMSVFWPFFIAINGLLYMTDTLANQGYISVSSWDEIHFMLITPCLLWTIAVWKNSTNTQLRLLSSAARLMTLAVFFEYVLKLWVRIDYPRILFNCDNTTLNYVSCF